ncbi:acyltransferase family protein [Arthrobacter crystallopoietes]|uniref:acyltransferase family protein n=1 Tax=Crystallibacter crystallopoietes TaxID=37928 RepID=UPI001ABE7DB7|nr:acyltransferase [Arthrobacter crystallopoietes]QTG80353.1 acyltransferase [Arthrobacter crystallopoietes]
MALEGLGEQRSAADGPAALDESPIPVSSAGRKHPSDNKSADDMNLSSLPKPRFRLLDGLRIFAALAVVLYHFTARENPYWGRPVLDVFPDFAPVAAFGALGVQLFFIISGFVILMSASGRSIGDYIASRAGRLLPGYWAGVLLTGGLLLVVWPEAADLSITQVLANLTMLQTPLGVDHVDGVYWTLWVELKFYALIGLFMMLGITKLRVLAVSIMWPIVAAIAEMADNNLLSEILMPDYAPLFAGGMLLFVLLEDRRNFVCWFGILINVALAAQQTQTGQFKRMEDITGLSFPSVACWLVVAGCFAVVAAATLSQLSRLSWTGLSFAGALTYPLYLIHEYVGWWVIHLIHDALPSEITLLLALGVCCGVAWAIWRYIETPFGPLIRRHVSSGILSLAPEPAIRTLPVR